MKEDELKIEEVAGLLHAPGADFVFGKYITIGTHTTMIFQRAIEDGYRAGIQAHTKYFMTSEEPEMFTPSDKDFTGLIDQCIPSDLASKDVDIWRAHFILGWTCVGLFLVPLDEEQ